MKHSALATVACWVWQNKADQLTRAHQPEAVAWFRLRICLVLLAKAFDSIRTSWSLSQSAGL